MIDIFANERLENRLWEILERSDPRDRVYVYRLDEEDRPRFPALFKGEPFPDLMEYLRDEHGGGEFRIMIRRSDKMILAGRIGVGPPPRSGRVS